MELDLTIDSLAKACKGDIKNLPSMVVHDDIVWPNWKAVRLDTENRIHMRRSTFNNTIAAELPVRAGLWLRADAQQFFFDLQPHHLQGSIDTMSDHDREAFKRKILGVDQEGNYQDEEDHGFVDPFERRPSAEELEQDRLSIQTRTGERPRGIRSSSLGCTDTE